jgi:hypothetical protein
MQSVTTIGFNYKFCFILLSYNLFINKFMSLETDQVGKLQPNFLGILMS